MVDGALGFVDVTCSGLARLKVWTPAQFQNHVGLALEERRRKARGEISQGSISSRPLATPCDSALSAVKSKAVRAPTFGEIMS